MTNEEAAEKFERTLDWAHPSWMAQYGESYRLAIAALRATAAEREVPDEIRLWADMYDVDTKGGTGKYAPDDIRLRAWIRKEYGI